MKHKLLPNVLVSIVLGLLFNLFFYDKVPGISLVLFSTCILLGTYYLAANNRRQPTRQILLISGLIMLFASMVFVRASGFLTFLNILAVMYLLLVLAHLIRLPEHRLQLYGSSWYLSQTLMLPFEFISELFGLGRRFVDNRNQFGKNQPAAKPIIRGLLLSIPFLVVFLLLFSSADLVFKRYVGSLFDFNLAPETLSRWLLVLFVASLFLGAYSLIFGGNKPKISEKTARSLELGTTESSIILGSVAFLFLIFVLIQVAYLFGGHSLIASSGFTYAEYARKGFFELIVTAVISLALILAVEQSTNRRTNQQKKTFTIQSCALIAEVIIIMLSAFKRLSLYEQAYGFTELRLYSHVFTIWLAVVFVLLAVRIIQSRATNQFPFQVFLSALAVLILMNFLNPDAWIANKNIDRYKQTGKFDTYYLSSLSEDAVPAISGLLHDKNERLQKTVASELYDRWARGSNDDWQSFNLARDNAKKILDANAIQLEANKDFVLDSEPADWRIEN